MRRVLRRDSTRRLPGRVYLFCFVFSLSSALLLLLSAFYRSNSATNGAGLFHRPKVAFLFLTVKDLPLDFLWDDFFQSADARRPYSLYIHARPGVEFNVSNTKIKLFWGRQISNSVLVEWGRVSMVTAERRLLEEALRDPHNQRFVLLSESCIFLHSYAFVYDYVMTSPTSFVDSFHDSASNTLHRYHPAMAPAVEQKMWRKGSQWFVLIRSHAAVFVKDKVVFQAFEQHCKNEVVEHMASQGRGNRSSLPDGLSDCIADEHYLQTLLAIKGREHEISRHSLTFSHWPKVEQMRVRDWHPASYNTLKTTPSLINSIQLISEVNFLEDRVERCGSAEEPRPCFIFARKFTRGAGKRIVLRMGPLVGLPDKMRRRG
eukprot:TRINITY_DN32337_c0_g1_i1.p1 TRINITY_DN32337_c0_g1~~TRINITY_DN32337_c0_g1_i1.p1  ORF type:complete len:374 (-),score=38.06 TRINITY_DN32337_c0_g1_i1:278-1399(-)